jgi:hypothetical protein
VSAPRILKDIKLKNARGKYNFDKIIEVESPVFFGIETIDNVNDTYNKLGARNIRAEVDGNVIFECIVDSIDFAKSRYINSFIAYDLLINEKRNVIKTRFEEGNKLNIYKKLVNNGVFEISDSLTHKVSITLTDDYNNKSSVNFKIKAKPKTQEKLDNAQKKSKFISRNNGGIFFDEGIFIFVQPESFTENNCISVEKHDSTANDFSPIFTVNLNSKPVYKALNLFIHAEIPDSLQNKVLLAGFNNDKFFVENAKYNLGFVNAKISSSANYYLTFDTISPTIKPRFNANADLRKTSNLKINISDDLSGIKSYNAYIDGEWALFEYDAKNNRLTYNFDSERIARNKKHNLKLIVSDYKDNTSVFESSFVW